VDDELACEPFSTPQQLLIPSDQGGFSLLDIEDEDHNNENTNNNATSLRGSSNRQSYDLISMDSDDNSNEETRFNYNHSLSAPTRTF